jgi:hypothetical protein
MFINNIMQVNRLKLPFENEALTKKVATLGYPL